MTATQVLINLIIAVLAGLLTDYVLGRCKVVDPIKVIVAVLVGGLVFFMNLAARVV